MIIWEFSWCYEILVFDTKFLKDLRTRLLMDFVFTDRKVRTQSAFHYLIVLVVGVGKLILNVYCFFIVISLYKYQLWITRHKLVSTMEIHRLKVFQTKVNIWVSFPISKSSKHKSSIFKILFFKTQLPTIFREAYLEDWREFIMPRWANNQAGRLTNVRSVGQRRSIWRGSTDSTPS